MKEDKKLVLLSELKPDGVYLAWRYQGGRSTLQPCRVLSIPTIKPGEVLIKVPVQFIDNDETQEVNFFHRPGDGDFQSKMSYRHTLQHPTKVWVKQGIKRAAVEYERAKKKLEAFSIMQATAR